jgi:hypothetical protein
MQCVHHACLIALPATRRGRTWQAGDIAFSYRGCLTRKCEILQSKERSGLTVSFKV